MDCFALYFYQSHFNIESKSWNDIMKDEIKQILDIHNQINQLTANLQSNKENLKKKKDKLSTMRTEQDFDKSELKMLEIEAEKLWKNLTNYMLYA